MTAELPIIGLAAFLVSGLTLFSGFGLGTVLTPVFALFFPVTLAVAATAVVHFANNLLRKAGSSEEVFVATGVVSAVIVDAVRLMVYGIAFMSEPVARSQELAIPVAVERLSAFPGAFAGNRLLRRVTLRAVRIVVAVTMLGVGGGLMTGLV